MLFLAYEWSKNYLVTVDGAWSHMKLLEALLFSKLIPCTRGID